MALRVLDRKALRDKGVPFSNVHLLRLEKAGKFPQRFSLTENRVAWLEDEVDRWIEERALSRHTGSVAPALAGGADACVREARREIALKRHRLAGNPAQRAALEDTSTPTDARGHGEAADARPA